ncbi:MRC [Mytilus coruscus]|uniref:MRC n=1 Tax=Mytilus coruscus TaxID=42192 RepID=A0A6J8C060_MYTCO|nr:MRC [Mytilus coruscus]
MAEEVLYANWNTTAPQTYTGVATVMAKLDFTWRGRQMTDRTGHALCQINYLPVVLGLTYAGAKAECLKYALHPALLITQEEGIIAKNALNTPNTVSENFWVGLTLNGTNYTWSDGTPALFTDWSPDEPNRLDIAKCVIIVGSEFQWDSKDCTTEDNVLCQSKTVTSISDMIPIILFIAPTNNRFPISNDIDQIGDDTTTTIGATYPATSSTISAIYPPISTTSVNAGDITQRHFLLNGLDVEPQNQPYHVTQCQSKIRCADHCLADHVCAAFVFNGWQCLLFNSLNPGSINPIAGSAIWK